MGNDLTKPGPNLYEAYGNSVARMSFPGDLLTFTKHGEYKAGQDKVDIPLGTRVVVHVPTVLIGFVRWEDSRPVDFQMGLLSDGFVPPKREELGFLNEDEWETFDDDSPKDPWQQSNQVVMTGADDNEVYTFTTSSKTGRSALGEVIKTYGYHIRQKPDEFPVVELLRRSYRHRRYGEQRVPVLKIIGWVPSGPPSEALAAVVGDGSGGTDAKAEPARKKPAAAKAIAASRTPVKNKTMATKAAGSTTPRRAKGPVRI